MNRYPSTQSDTVCSHRSNNSHGDNACDATRSNGSNDVNTTDNHLQERNDCDQGTL